MTLSPKGRKMVLLAGVALSLHLGFLFIKPLVVPEKKPDTQIVEKLKSI